MAPPDSDQRTSQKVENLEKPGIVQDGGTSQVSQATHLTAFHRYIHLPFELRAQIRKEAMEPARKRSLFKIPLSPFASVSREWQDDVERVLFKAIRIDPFEEEQISKFKELFTIRRKKLLTRLDIVIDYGDISPGYEKMGLLQISEEMEKVGQFLNYINAWDFCREGEKQQPIDIIFASLQRPRFRTTKYDRPRMSSKSLWEKEGLDLVTNRGLIPTNIALWAIKSEFPSSLNMVTHLTFNPDCVPLSAARKIISTMPNLETCVLQVSFGTQSEEGWRSLTDFILHLRISAPSLRKLMLHGRDWFSPPAVHPVIEELTAALKDFSQGLELLYAAPLKLHPTFFLPSSEELDHVVATSQSRWPRLQQLVLKSFSGLSDSGADQPTITPTDILIAAGRTAMAMPALDTAQITIEPDQYFCIGREPCKGFQGFRNASIDFDGFDEAEEQRILTAWAHFIGGQARLVKEEFYDEGVPPLRSYKTVVEEEAMSDSQQN